jgi:hypothetical protein
VFFIPLTVVRVSVMVVSKEHFLGWRSNYEDRLKSSWTWGSALLLCRGRRNSIISTECQLELQKYHNTDLTHEIKIFGI